jgi:hypothetical protein
MTDGKNKIHPDTFEGREPLPLKNEDDEKSGSDNSEDKSEVDGEDEKMVTLIHKSYEFKVPSHILEVDGFRADALDFFAGGLVIAYHKGTDGSFAWKQHEPHGQNYEILGAFALKDTSLEVFPAL